MSFNLGIFANYKGVTTEDIKKAYTDTSAKWTSTKQYENFCQALFKNYPRLENCTEEQLDSSPWAHTELCEGYMVLGFVSNKEKSDKGFNYVLRSAQGFGLIILDPQGSQVCIRRKWKSL